MNTLHAQLLLITALLALPAGAFADGGPAHGGGTGSAGGYTYAQMNSQTYPTYNNNQNTQAVLQNHSQSGQYQGMTNNPVYYYNDQTQTMAGQGVTNSAYNYSGHLSSAYNLSVPPYQPYQGAQTNPYLKYENPVTGQALQSTALQNSWTVNLPVQALIPRAVANTQGIIAAPQVVGFDAYSSVSLAGGLPSYYGANVTQGVYTLYSGESYDATATVNPPLARGGQGGVVRSGVVNDSQSGGSFRNTNWPFSSDSGPITGNIPW
ncbi:MAG: hypothetical protein COV10_03975 [Candidatus Vogelbacteria bacterium CG10_big_fil_rev_8_21_14_0_10_51_16]|uniref:Uncharacterized protein n=1 Tax=Candidatus Vogelbacteria bacterium CG10_big_fil_rev_8_21_14_0_10_51_16 TaxID=1975045 RepID=A0A2H0RDS1_9BACT|nr:MAG: hypothetical protein COV10_03975 [Candidatus Vogelbacteria bacterium CG10_big_fil_rev_8_21_14_0_10_51_16]